MKVLIAIGRRINIVIIASLLFVFYFVFLIFPAVITKTISFMNRVKDNRTYWIPSDPKRPDTDPQSAY